MSDGLKLISSILANESPRTLSQIEREMLIDSEVTAFDFVKSHLRQYRELPTVQTVQSETGVRLPAAPETLSYYVDTVSERHEYNLIRDRFATFREALQQRDMGVVADHISDMSRVIRRRRRGAHQTGEAVNLTEAGRMVTDRLRRIQGQGGVSGITTGWTKFDHITGGYQGSDLITWVGRMGLGKTYVLLKQAQAAHRMGHSVLFVTTEMGIEPLARRYAALETGVNPRMLRDGTISTNTRRRIENVFRNMVGAERLKIFSVGMNAKVDSIALLADEFGPDIIFIDGVYLLRPTDTPRNATHTDRVRLVFDEIRAMNLDMGIPYVVSTQFSRAAGKKGKEGTLETIGYSDAIGTHSSQVVAIKDGPTEDPAHSRLFDFLKGREGEHGTVSINFRFAPLNMDEMTQEELENEGEVTEASVEWMGVRRTQ